MVRVTQNFDRLQARPYRKFEPNQKNDLTPRSLHNSPQAKTCNPAPMDTGTALVDALLLGKLDGLSAETIFLYGRTGLLHLFSASGFHMGVALMMAGGAARLLQPVLPRQARAIVGFLLSLGLMTFFGQSTDWSSPLVRAYAFTALLSGAKVLEVKPGRHWVFVLSLLAAAVLGKGSTLSFLLSALGMAGVLFVGGKNLFTLALGPWLFTMPLVIWHFGLFSLASPLWNISIGLLISWFVLPPAILGLLLAALGIEHQWAIQISAQLMELFTRWLTYGDGIVGASFWVQPLPFFLLSACLLAIWFWGKGMPWLQAGLAATIAIFATALPSVKLAALDVGQGDSIFARLKSNKTILVDAGPPAWKKFPAPANLALEKIAEGGIDNLLLTHADRDHIGGAPSLLVRHRVREGVWLRRELLSDPRILPILAAAERADAKIKILSPSQAPHNLRCWLPPGRSSNELSPICHANLAGGKSLWLTGDAGIESERWLMQQELYLPIGDFLKVGHHGSKHSSSPEFLLATGASRALVNVGKNRYGHPHPEVVQRLEKLGIRIDRTDKQGSLVFY